MTGGILAIKLNSILEVSAGSIKRVGPGPKYRRSNTNVNHCRLDIAVSVSKSNLRPRTVLYLINNDMPLAPSNLTNHPKN